MYLQPAKPRLKTDTAAHLRSLSLEPVPMSGSVLEIMPIVGVCYVRSDEGTLVGFTRKNIPPLVWRALKEGTRVQFMYSITRSGSDLQPIEPIQQEAL
jgi:hypothetical protein